jgi:hypothetical protein
MERIWSSILFSSEWGVIFSQVVWKGHGAEYPTAQLCSHTQQDITMPLLKRSGSCLGDNMLVWNRRSEDIMKLMQTEHKLEIRRNLRISVICQRSSNEGACCWTYLTGSMEILVAVNNYLSILSSYRTKCCLEQFYTIYWIDLDVKVCCRRVI